MAVRRSARLQGHPAPGSVQSPQPPRHRELRADMSKKRKAPPAKTTATAIKSKRRATPSATHDCGRNSSEAALTNASADALSGLPLEVLNHILDNMESMSDMSKLSRTNKRYYSIIGPRLYRRSIIAAMFHAHIPKVIRALEPHLTIAQKRQLKKEGKYKGQKERYSSRLDQHATPTCAAYVKQMVVGVCSPGRKHEYIVRRYVEEAFKNMPNLEIIETCMLTEAMAQSIARMQNLKAQGLYGPNLPATAMLHLATLKDMQHLVVKDCGMGGDKAEAGNVVRSVLLNSASTLRSLEIRSNSWKLDFLCDWDKIASENGTFLRQKHDLTALESFTISGYSFDPHFIKLLDRAIDLMALSELSVGRLERNKSLLFDHLTDLSTSLQTAGMPIGLQKLQLAMWDGRSTEDHDATAARIRFVSSFNTLSSLEIAGYNQYPAEITTNPGLPKVMLQAILNHKNLKNLRISYNGLLSGLKVPYLSAATVKTIVDSLDQLEYFEFAPQESEIDDIGKAVSGGANLKSITCFPHDSWGGFPRPAKPGFNILTAITQGFLSRISRTQGEYENWTEDGMESLVWENHTKLRRVSVRYRTWDIASKFGKAAPGMEAPEKIVGDGVNQALSVLCRDITRTFPRYINIGYDPTCEWVEQVSKRCT